MEKLKGTPILVLAVLAFGLICTFALADPLTISPPYQFSSRPTTDIRQEYVEVQGPAYPGLNLALQTSTEQLNQNRVPHFLYQSPSGRKQYYWRSDLWFGHYRGTSQPTILTIKAPLQKK